MLTSQNQFRLGPPPALDSRRYAADLAEVRAYGAVDSTARNAHQTETATFWLGSSLTLYTEPLRVALSRTDQGIAGQARLVALFHVALVDTQIATSDSKYAYERWRPVTAIRTSPTAPGVTRTYITWKQLSDENVDARGFSGIHTRSADEAGITLGENVARYVLRNAGRLLGSR
ncbi:vanadium-dependent haloperoxidase [Streptomyces ipomoeae]|uniref:vanadium-dependent haloperoxidase n=1 Tax=Streptomyces ipomoeae TaxID=103232 RepID=UPI001F42BAF3|nr:vanadium-dependent haloperoxidase [Streptomyces ipomoeae]MDX2695814.1 vanadium-dependent haloperoxidase [Streptomyces ipomoeae]MDX2822925.1 vanadium-dependent haloperoxidase [Streptomyces ipomoeae]MDX2839896.1 vanadium-dependent haloperoxidase [Streptomyces ipomoeae]MDX2876640.1 vanadium-dependent haloperoxidase [Streptomyces ipomoeae]